MTDRCAARRRKLVRLLAREDVDVMLVSGVTNVRYLTGFTGDSTYLIVGPEHELVVSDFRYVTQLAEECPGLEASIRMSNVALHDATIAALKRCKPRRIGIESHLMSVELSEQLSAGLAGVDFVLLSGRIESELRAIKDPQEVEEIREAIRLAERGMDFLKSILAPDLSERAASNDLEHMLQRMGAGGYSFPAIIAVGDRAALPHYRPGERLVGQDPLLLVDWGAQTPSGYKSDLTRTLVTGRVTSKFTKVYETVLAAQERAIEAIRPGANCVDVDKIARDVIAEAGFGKRFGHGLGHGIGLDIHEQPRFAPISTDVLEPGMVVTVEPGIYLPGWGGVRIEDDVLVTKTGYEVLSSYPKQLDEIVVAT